MNLNEKLCEIIDTDSGFDNQEMANKIEKLFDEEFSNLNRCITEQRELIDMLHKKYKVPASK